MITKAFFRDRLVPADQALVSITSPCYRYGCSVFEGVKGYWNHASQELFLFRLDEHVKRLEQSARLLRFELNLATEGIKGAILSLLREEQVRQDVHVVPSLYVSGEGDVAATGPVELAVVARPRARPAGFDRGIHCKVSSWARISDDSMPPRIKSAANYQNSRLALLEARADGYDGAILLTRDGRVAEATGACVFILRGGVLITPTMTSGILESITRQTVLTLATAHLSLRCVEREVDRTELYISDEVFLCGTAAEITPVVSLDRQAIGSGAPGLITRAMQDCYIDIASGAVQDRPEWRTPVHSHVA